MNDLHKALADIGNIRQQLAAGTLFRGFGPPVIAATGMLALVTAAAQSFWFEELASEAAIFVGGWVITAVVSSALIGIEALTRSRRIHSTLADAMIFNTIEHFLPAGIAGAAIALVLLRFAPETLWMLPGLWQVLVSLGVFASMRFLPRSVALVAAWYFISGVAVLILSSQTQTLSPWLMGVPFAVGQILMAAILHLEFGGNDDNDR